MTDVHEKPHRRILIADDHLIYRLGIRSMLSTEPSYEIVAEAVTGTEAIDFYFKHRPDLVLLDLRMPCANGLEVIRKIILRDPDAKLLIVTSYEVEEEVFQVLRAGARGYLLKDLGRDSLFQAIETICAGGSWLPASVAAHLKDRSTRKDLTPREIEVATLIVRGLTNAEIGSVLSISESTVKNHVYNLLSKLQVSDRTEAASFCLSKGIVKIENV